jgi:phenylalanyl-tRNA synthetase beta chain
LPVVKVELERLEKLVGINREKIIERIPYIGLDIEEIHENYIRVEYSPNRPDFGSDIGIARALKGIVGVEKGLPKYKATSGEYEVIVDEKLRNVRPFITCALAESLKLDEEDIRQIISLQEDLHQGLGRKRARAAIGLHDASVIKKKVYYKAVGKEYSFQPLGYQKKMSVKEILEGTEQGLLYRHLLMGRDSFPVLEDSAGTTLSMPPIVNGYMTKITSSTTEIFVDVTGTDINVCNQVLNIITTTLYDLGAKIKTVKIVYSDHKEVTPDLRPTTIELKEDLIKKVTGLNPSKEELSEYLSRARLELKGKKVYIPCYRVDILHPVDIAEEVALGYGIDKIEGIYPVAKTPGKYNEFEKFIEILSNFLSMSGLLEVMEYELTDKKTLIDNFSRDSSHIISVLNPKSIEHSLLRDTLIPSLLSVLTRNVKEEYPQKIYEVGRVFSRRDYRVDEHWNLSVMICHSKANYTEAKSYLVSLFKTCLGMDVKTLPASHWAFSEGRTATVEVSNLHAGYIGEVKPEVLERFGIKVPVSGFELNISSIAEMIR